MTIITLSRQLGSGGDDIAVAVAERLGLRLAGRAVITQAARQAGVPEVALAEIDELGLLGVKPSAAALREYIEMEKRLILELAAEGHLCLVGRGGQVVLAGRPDVLHVRVIAPEAVRLQHVHNKSCVTENAARALVAASDRARAYYLRRHYQVEWDQNDLYDLILNMAHIAVPVAVDLICLAAQRIVRQN